ncbi:MAG: Na+/H+ antiporter subunit E [Campylobacterota bacterium]|nr:Na+/H+ antiporter subunit E [Campylobacterota bacterium]
MRILFWSLFLFVIWMVLSDRVDMQNITIGVLASVGVALLYTRIFEGESYGWITPVWLVAYLSVLIKNLVKSNISIAHRVLSRDMKLSPAIVAVKTDLTSDWKKLLLANSITLTPGTLTLDIEGETLYIHTIECLDRGEKEKITREFEEVIAKI